MEKGLNTESIKSNGDVEYFASSLFDDGEESESGLSVAIRTGDTKYLHDYASKFEVKADNELFYILDKITVRRDRNFDVSTVKYNKFIIEEMLSRSSDCLHVVMTLNVIGEGLTNQQHYDYLVRNIPVGRKKYRDGTKEYMRGDAREAVVRLLIMYVYTCNYDLSLEYYNILKVRKRIGEFVWKHRGYLMSPEADIKAKRYIKHKDQLREYNNIVDDLTGGKFDRDYIKEWG